jgi:hypothetical protein
MVKKLSLTIVLFLFACATVNPIPSDLKGADERAIYATNECRKAIQNASLDYSFNAYYSNGDFRYIGTKQQMFNFEKCLTDLGIKLKL